MASNKQNLRYHKKYKKVIIILTKKGRDVVIAKKKGDGKNKASLVEQETIKAFATKRSKDFGDDVESNDTFFITDGSKNVEDFSVLIDDGKEHSIYKVIALKPDKQIILHKVQCRN